jgi:hypothetical protein
MKYVAATGILLASLASEPVDIAYAQQERLPPVTVESPKPRTRQQVQSTGQQDNAPKKKKPLPYQAKVARAVFITPRRTLNTIPAQSAWVLLETGNCSTRRSR